MLGRKIEGKDHPPGTRAVAKKNHVIGPHGTGLVEKEGINVSLRGSEEREAQTKTRFSLGWGQKRRASEEGKRNGKLVSELCIMGGTGEQEIGNYGKGKRTWGQNGKGKKGGDEASCLPVGKGVARAGREGGRRRRQDVSVSGVRRVQRVLPLQNPGRGNS